MRKVVSEAAIKVGTNVVTAGSIGLVFIRDGATVAHSFLAIALGSVIIFVGIKVRGGGSE